MNKTRIAVTGANGFIGMHLCKLLVEEGYPVVSIYFGNKAPVLGEAKKCDITEEKAVSESIADVDIVVHLAAISNPAQCINDFDYAYKVNVEGTRNIIKATSSKSLIFASTSHVYGKSRTNGICKEDDPVLGNSPYAITKIIAEMLCNHYSWNENHQINIVRFFNIFGEYQDRSYVIPHIITQAISKQQITLRRMQIIRDFLYVGDAVNAILGIIRNGKIGTTYNVASGVGTSLSHIADYIADRIKRELSVKDLNIVGSEPPILVADIEKIKSIGWNQKVSLEEGLDKTLKFYQTLSQSVN